MALGRLWTMAYRDLLRNRRRSVFTLLAVALGLALLIVMNSLIAGVMEDTLQNGIRLQTGHVQIRAASYEEDKLSLQAKDLLDNPAELTARINAMSQVKAAAPVLWAGGLLNTLDESANVRIMGVDLASPLYAPIQAALVAGQFPAPDDRGGILVGKELADGLGIDVGQRVNLAIVDADGQPDEGTFTIRGLFSTNVPSYDESTIFMPLSPAQAFTRVNGRVSAIVILLHHQEETAQVAAALQSPGTTIVTWEDLNAVLLQTLETGMSFYVLLDAIVMMIVAVIIANTLLMVVFERVREMGILAALGMKGRHILEMFLFEAAILGLVGIVVGIALGSVGVAYLATVGIHIGNMASAAGNIALGTTMYGRFVPDTMVSLSIWTLVFVLLASLYPAWFATRLEPVKALHSQ